MTLWSNADAYEQFMGRWSRMLSREVAGLAARPGGAAVVRRVRRRGVDERGAGHQETALGARDRPVGGVRGGAALRPDSQATFRVASAQSIPLDDASVDVSVAGLSLNFTPDPVRALSEMGRVTRAGGTVAAYVWDYSGGMQMSAAFWGAATELDVGAPAETTRAGCRPEGLRQQFDDAGLHEVAVESIVLPMRITGVADFWTALLGGHAPAPAYVVSLPPERSRPAPGPSRPPGGGG